ncbi:MAG: glycoside hydrolase family 3 N-terminal domain-containing protein [Sporichthyaceae bacterium]
MDELTGLAARVVMASFPGHGLPDWLRRRLGDGLGSVCLFGSNIDGLTRLADLTTAIHAAGTDVLTATDEEGGDVTRLHRRSGSPHPGNAALGAVDDVALTEAVASEIGAELNAAGIDLNLAPVVDVNSNPDNPVIGVRSFGADPGLVARHTTAYVVGLRASGVGACVKHWPGHGDTAVDSHLGLPVVHASLDVLRRRELVPFAAAVKAGTAAVMTSYVLLPAVDAEWPATLSRASVELLRGDLGFDGLLVSDALDMAAVKAGRDETAVAVRALAAGVDLMCLGPNRDEQLVDAVIEAIVDAVRSGDLAEGRLVEAAGRVVACSSRVREWRLAARSRRPEATVNGFFAGPPVTPSQHVADRALRVRGTVPPLTGAIVLRFQSRTNMAVGAVPWGVLENGVVIAPERVVDVRPQDAPESLIANGVPVVALVRDLHRHPEVAEAVLALADRRPDLVVAEMGWPGEQPLPGSATVCTYGASRVSAKALDAVLANGSGPR